MAHSFGVEGLTVESGLDEKGLFDFFSTWLRSAGLTEAAFCLWSFSVTSQHQWNTLNAQLSSLKLARESREASLRLGKRFLSLAANLIAKPDFAFHGDAHLATAFGSTSAALQLNAEAVTAAYLHQSLFGAVSACQRLLPLGQSAAMQLLWELKPEITNTVAKARTAKPEDFWNTQPMLDIASMRHPFLPTRLFIS
jgi:urease accessory protein